MVTAIIITATGAGAAIIGFLLAPTNIEECPACKGEGWIRPCVWVGEVLPQEQPCACCNGDGLVVDREVVRAHKAKRIKRAV